MRSGGGIGTLRLQYPQLRITSYNVCYTKLLRTERFSKIGSQPVLSQNNVVELVQNTMEYLRTRTSDKVQFELITLETTLIIPLNPPLFEWVLENICKNAIDAIEGEGNITIRIENQKDTVGIDIADNGKGIRNNFV